MKRIYNFSAGPAILPEEVLQQASAGVLEIDGSGMSILEVSHRGPHYEAIHHDAESRLLSILGLNPAEWQPIFLGGGASLQFAMLPMNFLSADQSADYVNTGEWSSKAIKEAKRYGTVNIAASSESDKFASIPRELNLSPDAAYLHITTNNTIEGTEYSDLPSHGKTPLIADCSSDIFARNIPYNQFHMLYAGAQKNAGPAGLTIVLVRKDFLETANTNLPTMLSYKTHAASGSLYNTPPVFSIYVFDLVLKWIEDRGGLENMERCNRRKAALIYDALDEYPDIYDPAVTNKADRSLMNVTFRLKDKEREAEFLAGAKHRDMDGLKGHRSVGGFRASIYNAFPETGCAALAAYLREFARS